MSIKESKHTTYFTGLYTRLKSILNKTPKRSEYKERSYYNSKNNDLVTGKYNYEVNSSGHYVLTDKERKLAKALYEITGPRATLDDIAIALSLLQSKLHDPLAGYIHDISTLIGSSYDDIPRAFKGEYKSAPKAHRLLVDQISMYYYRG